MPCSWTRSDSSLSLRDGRQRVAGRGALTVVDGCGRAHAGPNSLCVYVLSSYLLLPRFSPMDAGGSAPQCAAVYCFAMAIGALAG